MKLVPKLNKSLKYYECGTGKPLVLLHGLMGALSNWNDVIEHFSKSYRVIIPELPILTVPLFRANLTYLVKFFNRFVKNQELENFALIGNSLGGHLALMYALKYPERIDAMVLTGSSGLYENSFGGTFPKRGDYEYMKEKVEFTFYSPKTATKELVDEVFEAVNDRAKILKIISFARSAIRHNLGDDLKKLKMPIGLIWGKNDKVTPPDVAEEFHAKIPNSDLYWMDCCGHAPMMEKGEEFNGLMEKYLQSINY